MARWRQGARGSNSGGDFYVQDVFEELDYPGTSTAPYPRYSRATCADRMDTIEMSH